MLLMLAMSLYVAAQLPVLRLTGSFGYDYQEGHLALTNPQTGSETQLTARIKWRGGTTNTPDKNKRNYKIKLAEDYSLLGMRSDNNWILDAGQADLFRLRNRIATELWNDMARKPYYSAQEPNAMSGVRGQVVEVYLNNEYAGIYCLTEAMDRKQMKLKKYDAATGTVRGALWKSTGYGSALMWGVSPYNNNSDVWDVFEAKYPKTDDLGFTDYATLYQAIDFVASSSDDEFKAHVEDYFDMPVIIDYYIFLLTLNAFDNVGKNMYWAVYNQQNSRKITPAVWDLDATVGQQWTEKNLPGSSSPEYEMSVNMYLYIRLKELNANNFNEKVAERYRQLRQSYLSTQSLTDRYTAYYDLISGCGAAAREEQRWSGDSDIDGKTLDFQSEIAFITDWIKRHMQYLDTYILSESTGIISTRTSTQNSIFYDLSSKKVMNPRRGIYIQDGKKYVIR